MGCHLHIIQIMLMLMESCCQVRKITINEDETPATFTSTGSRWTILFCAEKNFYCYIVKVLLLSVTEQQPEGTNFKSLQCETKCMQTCIDLPSNVEVNSQAYASATHVSTSAVKYDPHGICVSRVLLSSLTTWRRCIKLLLSVVTTANCAYSGNRWNCTDHRLSTDGETFGVSSSYVPCTDHLV